MTATPTTELDERFSDPGTSPTPWEETRRIIEEAELFWVTTVRDDGAPHVTPLVAVWLDDALHFCTGADEQKGVNLAANAHVVLTTGCNRWDDGIDVVVEGNADQVTDHDRLVRLAAAWAQKWDGRWQFAVDGDAFKADGAGQPLVYAVAPTKVLAFAKGDFSHTRHLF